MRLTDRSNKGGEMVYPLSLMVGKKALKITECIINRYSYHFHMYETRKISDKIVSIS